MILRVAMDRLFDDAFTRSLSMRGGSVVSSIDLYQTDDEVVVKASLPGLKSDDVPISITSDVLTLSGTLAGMTRDEARADFENGILTISLPKAETVKPKTINIKAN